GAAALVARLLDRAGAAASGIDRLEATHRYIADYTPRSLDETRLFPGTEDALDRLRRDGWRLAVCTNKPVAAARHILEGMSISPLFAAIAGGDSYPTRKPDPASLRGAVETAGSVAARAVMVGDHTNDIQAASGAQVASIFARWGYGRPEMETGATAACATIGDIPGVAERLIPA
ncbi:HAD-IA family hydrolase, partial [Ameyamaea chiangmaiensis]